jgi:hypothetical protein
VPLGLLGRRSQIREVLPCAGFYPAAAYRIGADVVLGQLYRKVTCCCLDCRLGDADHDVLRQHKFRTKAGDTHDRAPTSLSHEGQRILRGKEVGASVYVECPIPTFRSLLFDGAVVAAGCVVYQNVEATEDFIHFLEHLF